MKLTKAQSIAIKTKLAKVEMTQQDIANFWGVSKQHVNAMLSGREYMSKQRFDDFLEIAEVTEKELNLLANYLDR